MLLNVWTKHTQTNSVHVTNIKRLILVWFWFDFYLNFSPLRRYPPVCMRVACCYCYCVCEIATASYEQPWQQLQHLQQRWSDWKLQLGWLTKTTKTTTTTRRCNAPALPFPVERPGMSAFGEFTFISALYSLAVSWFFAKAPRLGQHIALKLPLEWRLCHIFRWLHWLGGSGKWKWVNFQQAGLELKSPWKLFEIFTSSFYSAFVLNFIDLWFNFFLNLFNSMLSFV